MPGKGYRGEGPSFIVNVLKYTKFQNIMPYNHYCILYIYIYICILHICMLYIAYVVILLQEVIRQRVKQSRYRPRVVQRVPGSYGSQIS